MLISQTQEWTNKNALYILVFGLISQNGRLEKFRKYYQDNKDRKRGHHCPLLHLLAIIKPPSHNHINYLPAHSTHHGLHFKIVILIHSLSIYSWQVQC